MRSFLKRDKRCLEPVEKTKIENEIVKEIIKIMVLPADTRIPDESMYNLLAIINKQHDNI